MAVDIQFVNALVAWGRLSKDNAAQILSEFGNYKIAQLQGRQLSSVSVPGNTVTWRGTMTPEERFEALYRALGILGILSSNNRVWKRTCNRVFV